MVKNAFYMTIMLGMSSVLAACGSYTPGRGIPAPVEESGAAQRATSSAGAAPTAGAMTRPAQQAAGTAPNTSTNTTTTVRTLPGTRTLPPTYEPPVSSQSGVQQAPSAPITQSQSIPPTQPLQSQPGVTNQGAGSSTAAPGTAQVAVRTNEPPQVVTPRQPRLPLPMPPAGPATPTSTLLSSVDSAIAEGDLERAAALCERALRISPRDGYLWYRLASIHFEQQRYSDAEGFARRSLSFAGSDANLSQAGNTLLDRISAMQ